MIKTIKRLLHWAKNYKKRLYLGFICSFLGTWCTAIPTIIAAWALGIVLKDLQGIEKMSWNIILLAFIGIVVSIFFRFVFSYWKAKLQESIGCEVAAEERIEIGNILKRVSLGYFTKNTTGEILTAVTSDISSLELQGMKLIDSIVNGYVNLLATILMLTVFCPPAAVTSLLGILLSALALNAISKHSKENAPTKQIATENLTDAAIEYIRGLPIVKSFGQEGVSISGWKAASTTNKHINIKIMNGIQPFTALHLLALKLSAISLILLAGIFTIQGTMNLPFFLLIAMFAFMIFAGAESINESVHMLGLIDTSMDKLEKIKKSDFIDKDGKNIIVSNYDIHFQNVCFGYAEKEILHDVSFHIAQNTSTAIIGPSGSGKTTICNVIARFYDVQSGSICLGGHNLKDFTCDSLLSNISMVFQKVYLFHDTIKNNIKFGNPHATDEKIIEASKNARCHDFIMALPDGYDTMIGETGSSLSGGEKQRISIARAILKDAPIVILDEATASIDPENEHLIQKAISQLTQGKTIITIAHRLATIENADQILVMDAGRISQRGTHKELIQKEGIYKNFITIRKQTENWSF